MGSLSLRVFHPDALQIFGHRLTCQDVRSWQVEWLESTSQSWLSYKLHSINILWAHFLPKLMSSPSGTGHRGVEVGCACLVGLEGKLPTPKHDRSYAVPEPQRSNRLTRQLGRLCWGNSAGYLMMQPFWRVQVWGKIEGSFSWEDSNSGRACCVDVC